MSPDRYRYHVSQYLRPIPLRSTRTVTARRRGTPTVNTCYENVCAIIDSIPPVRLTPEMAMN